MTNIEFAIYYYLFVGIVLAIDAYETDGVNDTRSEIIFSLLMVFLWPLIIISFAMWLYKKQK